MFILLSNVVAFILLSKVVTLYYNHLYIYIYIYIYIYKLKNYNQ